ncbi:MAG: formyltetrahydrofolate deformylase [Candidatus Omnitrophota bacterium]|nr:MAG: formyltetrahydrofolate deformylase [Candidatus Omnitrophota bacterium]
MVLLLQCGDQKGIVAKVSDFIFRNDGNIITANQHTTDPAKGHFSMRVEFEIDSANKDILEFKNEFSRIADSFGAKWQMHDKSRILNMGILVSKPDHCLVDLLYLVKSGELPVNIPFVISNYENHRSLAEQYHIPFYYVAANKSNRQEDKILALANNSDFLVLARYMLVLSKNFLSSYAKDIINIHHGFLPSFKGANPYRQALDRGVKVIGATAHFVNEDLDDGPIISQSVEYISHNDDLTSLIRKGKNLEKRALSSAISSYIDYRIIRLGNKTIVF